MARFLRDATTLALPVLSWWASSRNVAESRSQCRTSIFQWPLDQGGEVFGSGLGRGEVGDGQHRDRALLPGFAVGDVPLDEHDLGGAGEAQAGRGGHDLDGANFVAAVAAVGGHLAERDLLPRQRVDLRTADPETAEQLVLTQLPRVVNVQRFKLRRQ
jgi:hypothetical protein